MEVEIVAGDLLDQATECIVNPWNRNLIPWWLLRPHGVSGAIKKRGGVRPFQELRQKGPIRLGEAVHTSAGRLPYRRIIHVASIDLWGRSSAAIIQPAVKNAMLLAEQLTLDSLAFPVLGTGSGQVAQQTGENAMLETFATINSPIQVVIVRYAQSTQGRD